MRLTHGLSSRRRRDHTSGSTKIEDYWIGISSVISPSSRWQDFEKICLGDYIQSEIKLCDFSPDSYRDYDYKKLNYLILINFPFPTTTSR